MNLVFLVTGGLLLVLGRKLFWLLVAVLGFLAGFYFAGQQFGGDPVWLALGIGIVAGVAGALLAMVFQSIAIAAAGFLGGGLVALNLLEFIGMGDVEFAWVAFIVGGIIGIILISLIFDWALIFLSSLVGAFLIVNTVEAGSPLSTVIFLVLVVAGIATQAWIKRRWK